MSSRDTIISKKPQAQRPLHPQRVLSAFALFFAAAGLGFSLAGTSPCTAAEDVFASSTSQTADGTGSGGYSESSKPTSAAEIFKKYGYDMDNPPGYVPQKDENGNWVMPDYDELGDRPVPNEDQFEHADPNDYQNADESQLKPLDKTDEELKEMGVDPSVIESMHDTGMSEKEEWGCTCYLCLANPNGWRSVSECHPPIKRLKKWLKDGHSMPSCPKAGAGNYMQLVRNPVESCRKMGLKDAPAQYVSGRFYARPSYSAKYENEGTGYCVGNYLGRYSYCLEYDSEGYCRNRVTVNVYDRVEYNPRFDPDSIDVFIEGKLFMRNHGWRD